MSRHELAATAFQALAEKLQSASFRKAFDKDPARALESAGIDKDLLGDSQLDALAELNLQELELLGRLSARVGSEQVGRAAGHARDTNGGIFF